MTIEAELPNGTILEFPDGTSNDVIQNAVRSQLGVSNQQVTEYIPPQQKARLGIGSNPRVRRAARSASEREVTQDEPRNINSAPVVDSVGVTGDQLEFAGSGVVEPALTLGTGMLAEPVAGLAGIAQSINPFADEGAGSRAVEATREALTFQPRTKSGQESLQSVGEVIEPVAKVLSQAEKALGDGAFKVTGSPALAAAAATIPTALAELIGVGAGKGALKSATKIKKAASQGKIAREIAEAVPSIDQLKDVSRSVYKEIDDLGATLKPDAFDSLTKNLSRVAKEGGVDPDITPKAAKALARFGERVGDDITLTEVDTLRKVAQNAAKSLEPAEAAIGARMIESVDSFLDNIGPAAFSRAEGSVQEVGKRYKVARELWGRARKSELLQDSFEKARNQASGFENGIRVQFRSILNNKKQRKFFKANELEAMKRVVRGDKKENFAKLVGRLGFSEGGATNILGAATGAAGGAAAFGAPGAVIVPVIGQVSRKLAQRMTARNAEFADQVIRSGKDANKIAASYIRNTPKARRNAAELSELLMQPDIQLSVIPKSTLLKEAAKLAAQNRAVELGGVLGASQIREE